MKEKCPKRAFFSRAKNPKNKSKKYKTGNISRKKRQGEAMGIKGKNDRMVVLACEDCKERNYTTTKNKKTNKDRMEMKKHCPRFKRHTVLK